MSDTSRHYTIHCAIPSPCTKLKRSCRPPACPAGRRIRRAGGGLIAPWLWPRTPGKSRAFSTRRHDAVRTPERRDALVARHAPPRVRAAGAGILLEPATLADASPCLWRLPRRPGMRSSKAPPPRPMVRSDKLAGSGTPPALNASTISCQDYAAGAPPANAGITVSPNWRIERFMRSWSR